MSLGNRHQDIRPDNLSGNHIPKTRQKRKNLTDPIKSYLSETFRTAPVIGEVINGNIDC